MKENKKKQMTLEQINIERFIKGQEIIDKNKITTCDDAFAQYLLKCSKHVVQKFYRILALFFDNFRKWANQYGWDMHQKFKRVSNADISITKQYTAFSSPNLLPKLIEIYLQRYTPVHLPKFDRFYAISIGKHFWDWLFENGYTDLMISDIEK